MSKEKECFVIMPFDPKEGYEGEHFKKIYNTLFKPAIEEAGFIPRRTDDDNSSHEIKLEIIRGLLDADMVLCDLSSLNPNVMFELGIRQAFDKPVVLVEEVGTSRIFDIDSINTVKYHKERIYEQVLEDKK